MPWFDEYGEKGQILCANCYRSAWEPGHVHQEELALQRVRNQRQAKAVVSGVVRGAANADELAASTLVTRLRSAVAFTTGAVRGAHLAMASGDAPASGRPQQALVGPYRASEHHYIGERYDGDKLARTGSFESLSPYEETPSAAVSTPASPMYVGSAHPGERHCTAFCAVKNNTPTRCRSLGEKRLASRAGMLLSTITRRCSRFLRPELYGLSRSNSSVYNYLWLRVIHCVSALLQIFAAMSRT